MSLTDSDKHRASMLRWRGHTQEDIAIILRTDERAVASYFGGVDRCNPLPPPVCKCERPYVLDDEEPDVDVSEPPRCILCGRRAVEVAV